jgi:hypothetical protein
MQLVGYQARDTPAHGLAADDEGRARPGGSNRGTVFVYESLRLRGRPARATGASGGHIGEFKAEHCHAALGQQLGEDPEERGIDARARPVGAQEARRSIGRACP